MWNSAEYPPDAELEFYSKSVIVVTDLGNVHEVSYFNGSHGGCWQRLSSFKEKEQIVLWTHKPKV